MGIGKELDENYVLKELLEAWGIDVKDFSSAMIVIDEDSIVTVTAVHRKKLDNDSVRKVGTRFALIELKNE